MANVLNVEIVTLEKEEGPAFGAAILAAVGCGEYKNVYEAADKLVRIKEVYMPDAEVTEKYREKYAKFAKMYQTVKNLFN